MLRGWKEVGCTTGRWCCCGCICHTSAAGQLMLCSPAKTCGGWRAAFESWVSFISTILELLHPLTTGEAPLDCRNGTTGEQVVVLHNKSPKWNDALNAYCLNFGGRVTEASVKNFQLVTEAEPDALVLQFGKVSDSCFTCDFKWPLSPLQAFCICLASFDNKLACE
eukprot:GHRQ01009434.1.p2 GENE.GHRQ01009434.1~~GHRQ01009434.1.p2  ORF type:complete len:166 (-),score=42.34 GHRQ01009434.1:445-942(-)